MCMLSRLIIVVFTVFLSSCGGGGSSAGTDVSTTIGDISGVWSTTETAKNHNCELNPSLKEYTLTVKQSGNSLTIIDDEGNSYSSTLKGANFSWTGNYEEDAPDGTPGKINLNPMSASVEASCNKLSGTANWTWTATDGSGYSCSGTTSFSATRSTASGCGAALPDDGSTPVNTDTQAPSAPQRFKYSSTSSTINIKWSASTDNVAVAGYSVFRDGLYLQEGTVVDSEKTVTYTDSGLTPSTQYCYTALAYDAAGNKSAQSAQQCVTTAAIVSVDAQAPTVPTNLKVLAVSSSQLNLSWSAASDNVAVTGYNIYRNGSFTKSVTSTSASDINLTASTNYCYRVLAKDAAGNSSTQSAQVCAFTKSPEVTIPATPDNITASNITYNSAKITWTDNSSNEEGFEIGTCSGGVLYNNIIGLTCSSGFTVVAQVQANAYVLNNLQASTEYSYYVRAYNSAGVSLNRNVTFTTAPAISTVTFFADADNMVMRFTGDPSIANTYYNTSENGVGCNWSYSYDAGILLSTCATSLIYFDMNSIVGKKIRNAKLSLSVDVLPSSFTQYKIWAIFDNWFNAVTWNTMPQVYVGSGKIFSQPTSNAIPFTVDVTNIVSKWADGSWVNRGFMLEDNNYTTPYSNVFRATNFCSLESCGGGETYFPQLIIEYE